jgi:hypothetical protein
MPREDCCVAEEPATNGHSNEYDPRDPGRVARGADTTYWKAAEMQARRGVVASIVAVGVLSGCGGSNKSSSAPTATQTSTPASNPSTKVDPAFVARVNAVCAQASKGAVQFPYHNFDPVHPDPKLLPKVGAFFAKRQPVADAVPKQLGQLGSPAIGKATWSQMLALATRDRAIADRQIKAAKASDVKGFVATVNEVAQVSNKLGHLADQAGFSTSSPCRMIF